MEPSSQQSFGVFKPVGHVVLSFATPPQADAAAADFAGSALGNGLVRYSDTEMLAQTAADLERATPLASIGQELNLVKAHRALAQRGYHWLVVPAPNDETAARVADLARAHGAERAQYYGRFIIEELIEHPGDEPQVFESPDRGLDAQTPSGQEAERANLRPQGDEPGDQPPR